MYAQISMVALAFLSGFGLSHKIDTARIQSLEFTISAIKTEAETTLRYESEKTDNANALAIKFNQSLDIANAQSIKTINALHADLAASLQSKPYRGNRSGSMPGKACPEVSEKEAGTPELPARVLGFFEQQAYEAAKVALFADTCYTYLRQQERTIHE